MTCASRGARVFLDRIPRGLPTKRACVVTSRRARVRQQKCPKAQASTRVLSSKGSLRGVPRGRVMERASRQAPVKTCAFLGKDQRLPKALRRWRACVATFRSTRRRARFPGKGPEKQPKNASVTARATRGERAVRRVPWVTRIGTHVFPDVVPQGSQEGACREARLAIAGSARQDARFPRNWKGLLRAPNRARRMTREGCEQEEARHDASFP